MGEKFSIVDQIKSRLSNQDNKSLFNNFIALFILQLINYALPLIILPYLTQKLGPSNYGKVAWAQYAIQYLIIFTDYGFNFSATRLISINRDNKEYIQKIFNAVLFIKMGLLILSYLLLIVFIQINSFGEQENYLLQLSFLMVAGSVLAPLWFFQGVEKMKWVTIVNVVIKTLLVVAVFVLVKNKSDVILTGGLLAGSQLLIGVFSLILALNIYRFKISIPSASEIFFQFREGWLVFLSTLFTSIYVTSNGFLLGEWTNDTAVGYYTPAEKIVRAATSFFNPVMLALYPFISKKFADDRNNAIRLFFKLLIQVSAVTLLVSVLLFLLAPLADDFLGKEYENSIDVIKWLAFIPFFGTAGALLSYHLFLNVGLRKTLPFILGGLAIMDIVLCYYLIPVYQHTGAAMALFIIEMVAPFIYLIVYYFYSLRNAKD